MNTDTALLSKLKAELEAFFISTKRNTHVSDACVTLYVRKSVKLIPGATPGKGQYMEALDLATIDVIAEEQGMGWGTMTVQLVHDLNPFPITFIENVLNSTLERILKKEGWLVMPAVGDAAISPCFYKLTGRSVPDDYPGRCLMVKEMLRRNTTS